MLGRTIFPTPAFKRAYETRPRLSAHGASAAFSNLHRLAPQHPLSPTHRNNRNQTPSPPFPLNLPRTQRAPFSLWPSSSANPIQQRVAEASHRYNDLNDRQLLLLYLDKQDEAWRKQSSRVRMPSWSDYAGWVLNAGALLYGYYFVWPQMVAASEETGKATGRNWNTVTRNQRCMYDKLVEVEKRLEEKKSERGVG